jgi:hypothetical protein
MIQFDIRSLEFRGLMITCTADRDGVSDACFSSSQRQLPESMYRRLVNNHDDMNQIWDEISNAVEEMEL